MILILTGPTRSHKTSTLFEWAKKRDDCGGVLTPDRKTLRMLYNVKEKKSLPFQKPEMDAPSDVTIGRFVFDGEGFKKAASWLDEHLADPKLKYILIDEVGALELEGGGFDQWLRGSIATVGDKTLILVVRRNLLDDVMQRYDLQEVSIVEKDYFLPDGAEKLPDDMMNEGDPE